jgi:formate C-acetyltransferase
LAVWKGYELLARRILAEVPHYGNADPYADEEFKMCSTFIKAVPGMPCTRSKVYKSGF